MYLLNPGNHNSTNFGWSEFKLYLSVSNLYLMPSFGELSILHEALSTTLRDPCQEKLRASWKKTAWTCLGETSPLKMQMLLWKT